MKIMFRHQGNEKSALLPKQKTPILSYETEIARLIKEVDSLTTQLIQVSDYASDRNAPTLSFLGKDGTEKIKKKLKEIGLIVLQENKQGKLRSVLGNYKKAKNKLGNLMRKKRKIWRLKYEYF